MLVKNILFKSSLTLIISLLIVNVCLIEVSSAETQKTVRIFLTLDEKYEEAGTFNEGRAMVGASNKYGFVDLTGSEVVSLQYDEVKPFHNGLAAVKKNGLWGYIDKEGNVKISIKYDEAETFSEGLAVVSKNGKYGYLDPQGHIAIDLKYSHANSFSDGMASVQQNGKYGFIDKIGNVKIAFQYAAANSFSEDRAAVGQITSDGNLNYGYIDKKGNLIINYKYAIANPFHDGRANVNVGNWIGYVIDKKGNSIFQQNFIQLKDDGYNDGLALVFDQARFNEGYGYIDGDKNVVIPLKYWYASSFSEGVAWVIDTSPIRVLLIDKNNTAYTSEVNLALYDFDSVRNPFVNGLSLARSDGKIVYVSNPLDQPSNWANEGLDLAREQGLLPTHMDYQYQKPITREDFSKLALHVVTQRLNKSVNELLLEHNVTSIVNVFADTVDDDVEMAYSLGLVSGKENNTFDPNGAITRQEAAVMLTRVAKFLGIQSKSENVRFEDTVSIANWAQTSVQYITSISDPNSKQAVMGGVGNNKFSPTATYTREQAFITMSRLYTAN